MSCLTGKSFNPVMNRRSVIAGVAGLGAVGILAGCSGNESEGGSTAAADDGSAFKIGAIGPLTGSAASYGTSVCNGVELSSGAVRNHDPEIMVKAFELVRLGEDDVKAKFPAMYNAFCYGAPPHAGIAPGVDRMVMLLAGEDCIREIIPFPMNKNAQDVMMGAPGTVEPHQLEELHIAVVGDTEPDTEA